MPFAITVALLVPPALPLRARMVAIGVFLVSFVAVAFPVLRAMSNSGNTGHVVMLGLGADFDGPLRIEPSVYEFGGRYVDSLAFTTINSHAIRVDGRTRAAEGGSPEYDRVANAYLARIAETFPADVVTRVAAAVRATPKYSRFIVMPAGSSAVGTSAPYACGQSALADCAHRLRSVCRRHPVKPTRRWLIVLVMIGFAGPPPSSSQAALHYLQFVLLCIWVACPAAIARRRS